MSGAFPKLQAMYAGHQVATYPVNHDKTPAISHYGRIGAPGSAQIAMKFSDADAAGFVAGSRNQITIIDIDNPDERLVAEMQHRFGVTPLQVITPSGGRHLYYRHNGETRRIRAMPDVDILGAGPVVAALSIVSRGRYAIERGTLDDLARLPKLRAATSREKQAVVQKGQRNEALFQNCHKIVESCDDIEQFIDAAQGWADGCLAQPLSEAEIRKTCGSVWKYREGRRCVGKHIIEAPVYAHLKAAPNAMALFAVLSAENGDRAEFMVADGLGEASGWPRRLVPAARKKLLELGVIQCVRRPRKGTAALYRWVLPQ